MIRVPYETALSAMRDGLKPYLPEAEAARFAAIFAGNSADGVASHGMNRYPRYLSDMDAGLCDRTVTRAEVVSGFGALEAWDAHFGVGPLIAEDAARRVSALAKEHGVACVTVRNNSHWLRAGRYGLMIAEEGLVGLCFTNTCLNLTAWGAKASSTGNNPMCLAVPRRGGSLLMDMAVSQYAYGKLEIMAQEGKMLPQPWGYDKDGNETADPAKLCESGLMWPMAMWKGSALSIMLDLAAATLSGGRTSLEIGDMTQGEAGMSQVFIALHPAAVQDMGEAAERVERTIAFLHGLEPAGEGGGVHAPGEGLPAIRARNLKEGLPVTEGTWRKIEEAAARGRAGA